MADKSKNFGNKVANFGKKFVGGLLFDDLPEAAEVSEADRLEYPLHDTQDYKSCIEFGTIQEEGVDLEGLIGFGSLFGKNETIEDESDEDKANREKKESEAKQKQEDAAKTLLESQDNVDSTEGKDDAVQTTFGIGNTSDVNPQILKKCKLYLPAAIPFRDTASYENADLGMAGALAEAGGNASKGLVQSLLSGLGSTAAAAFEGSGAEGLGRLAMTKVSVGKYLGGEGTALAVKQASGVTLNPNTRSLFKSVALREFAFQFKFIPLSKQEHDTVQDIIKFFRHNLYPENININIGDQTASIGYKFPKRFHLKILYNERENFNAPKILPCYLRDVTTTFNPSNQSMHANGEFGEIDMSLAFTETRTLAKNDLVEGGF